MQRFVLLTLALLSLWAHAEVGSSSKVTAETDSAARTMDPIKKIDKEDREVLQRHLPFYFIYGEPLSKLQFSFKIPIVRDVPFYFAYTQLMFWELQESSKPFLDSTYNPEFFYRWTAANPVVLHSLDLGLWSHNSNGKDGEDSRSYDKQYVRLNYAFEGSKWVTRLSAELAYLNHFDDNPDIQDYVGPLNLYLYFVQLFDAYVDKSEILLKVSPGGKWANEWDQGGYQMAWAFRLGKIKIVPAFYFQYYHGFAETLLNYDENVDEFRVGFLL